jgi:Uma2 family endonuclease
MSAQPIEPRPYQMWTPDPVRQRLADYTVEDLLALPSDAPRVELRDGVMIVVPSPTLGHQNIQFLLQRWLYAHAPKDMRVAAAVGVIVGVTQTFEPDVLLLLAEASDAHHFFKPEQVVLVVEIVSAGTKKRDRIEKPADYAAAGIPFFWRIEQDPVRVFAYELGLNHTYQLVTDSDTELVLERPFEIRLPIAEITP